MDPVKELDNAGMRHREERIANKKEERASKDAALNAAFLIADMIDRSAKNGSILELREVDRFEAQRYYRNFIMPRFFKQAFFFILLGGALFALQPFFIPLMLALFGATSYLASGDFYVRYYIRGVNKSAKEQLRGVLFGRSLSWISWIIHGVVGFLLAWLLVSWRFESARALGAWSFQAELVEVGKYYFENFEKIVFVNFYHSWMILAIYAGLILFVVGVKGYEHLVRFTPIHPKHQEIAQAQKEQEQKTLNASQRTASSSAYAKGEGV